MRKRLINSGRTGKAAVILIWGIIIIFCALNTDKVTAEGIAGITPKAFVPAMFVFSLLFALKSLSVVIPSAVLYAAAGLMFPLWQALIINTVGSVVMFMLPYYIGIRGGNDAVERISAKYPRTAVIKKLRKNNDFLFVLIIRLNGILSYDVVSMYMGAVKVRAFQYYTASLLGSLPYIALFTVLGMSADDPSSPEFIISLAAQGIITVFSIVYGVRVIRAEKKEG